LDVFRPLGHPFELFAIGGKVRDRSDSITSEYATKCIRSWGASFDVAIIGATNVFKKDTWSFCCFGGSEAIVKADLLYNSQLRIITADCSKVASEPEVGACSFASSDAVDLLVTDSAIRSPEYRELLQSLTKGGVSVIAGPETKGDPIEEV
jgi:DeoR/GlpR family transcriptional regulator of sugar metabolism